MDKISEGINQGINKAKEDLEKLQDKDRQLKIKDEYFKLIIDIGYDYDGFEDPKNLKELIDELVSYARMGLKNDDKTNILGDDEHPRNILLERI